MLLALLSLSVTAVVASVVAVDGDQSLLALHMTPADLLLESALRLLVCPFVTCFLCKNKDRYDNKHHTQRAQTAVGRT